MYYHVYQEGSLWSKEVTLKNVPEVVRCLQTCCHHENDTQVYQHSSQPFGSLRSGKVIIKKGDRGYLLLYACVQVSLRSEEVILNFITMRATVTVFRALRPD